MSATPSAHNSRTAKLILIILNVWEEQRMMAQSVTLMAFTSIREVLGSSLGQTTQKFFVACLVPPGEFQDSDLK
jgi:hypothetical protein